LLPSNLSRVTLLFKGKCKYMAWAGADVTDMLLLYLVFLVGNLVGVPFFYLHHHVMPLPE
jgi:hypothetical protein